MLLQIQTQFEDQMRGMGRLSFGGAAERTLIREGSVTFERKSNRGPISVTVEDGVIVSIYNTQ